MSDPNKIYPTTPITRTSDGKLHAYGPDGWRSIPEPSKNDPPKAEKPR